MRGARTVDTDHNHWMNAHAAGEKLHRLVELPFVVDRRRFVEEVLPVLHVKHGVMLVSVDRRKVVRLARWALWDRSAASTQELLGWLDLVIEPEASPGRRLLLANSRPGIAR